MIGVWVLAGVCCVLLVAVQFERSRHRYWREAWVKLFEGIGQECRQEAEATRQACAFHAELLGRQCGCGKRIAEAIRNRGGTLPRPGDTYPTDAKGN